MKSSRECLVRNNYNPASQTGYPIASPTTYYHSFCIYMLSPQRFPAVHIYYLYTCNSGSTYAYSKFFSVCMPQLWCVLGCSTHWSNIHHTLLHALPDQSIIHFHHTVTDFHQAEGSNQVRVTAEVGEKKELKTFEGELLVAADGSMSQVRAKFRPEDNRRYTQTQDHTLDA